MANLQQLTSLEQRDREAVTITLSADELGEGRRSGGSAFRWHTTYDFLSEKLAATLSGS